MAAAYGWVADISDEDAPRFVGAGEIAAVVGPEGAGKTTLLRYVGRRSDGAGGVLPWFGRRRERPEAGPDPRLAFQHGRRRIPAEVALGAVARCPGPTLCAPELGAERLRLGAPDGWSEAAGNGFFAIRSQDGTVRDIGWEGAGPNDPDRQDRQDLLLVDDLSTKRWFGDATRPAGFHLRRARPAPESAAAHGDLRDARPFRRLGVTDRIAVLRRGRSRA